MASFPIELAVEARRVVSAGSVGIVRRLAADKKHHLKMHIVQIVLDAETVKCLKSHFVVSYADNDQGLRRIVRAATSADAQLRPQIVCSCLPKNSTLGFDTHTSSLCIMAQLTSTPFAQKSARRMPPCGFQHCSICKAFPLRLCSTSVTVRSRLGWCPYSRP